MGSLLTGKDFVFCSHEVQLAFLSQKQLVPRSDIHSPLQWLKKNCILTVNGLGILPYKAWTLNLSVLENPKTHAREKWHQWPICKTTEPAPPLRWVQVVCVVFRKKQKTTGALFQQTLGHFQNVAAAPQWEVVKKGKRHRAQQGWDVNKKSREAAGLLGWC